MRPSRDVLLLAPGSAAARLAAQLGQRRRAAGLLQSQLAERIGYSREYVVMVEGCRRLPSLEFMIRCDHALVAHGVLILLFREATKERAAGREALRLSRIAGLVSGQGRGASSSDELELDSEEPLLTGMTRL